MSFPHPILHKQIITMFCFQLVLEYPTFRVLVSATIFLLGGEFSSALYCCVSDFFIVYLCFLLQKIFYSFKKKIPNPTFFPGHTFDVLLNIVVALLRYCGFCRLSDIFSYLVTLTSHLFYYRLHREAITALSCQSSRTICMTLLVYDLILGGRVRNRELDFMVLWGPFRLEIFYDSMFYLTEVSYVRQ